jgi:hypothetical protein
MRDAAEVSSAKILLQVRLKCVSQWLRVDLARSYDRAAACNKNK